MIKFLQNPWVIKIGGGIVVIFLMRFIDSLTGSNIWSWIKIFFNDMISFFTIKINLPLYGLILLWISGPLIGYLLLIRMSKSDKLDVKERPKWIDYKEDIIGGLIYKWQYIEGDDGKYLIHSITPFCLKCNCHIVNTFCPNCKDNVYDRMKSDDDIKALIMHRIEKDK